MPTTSDLIEDDWNLLEDYHKFREAPFQFLGSVQRLMLGTDFAAYDTYTGSRLFTGKNWQADMINDTVNQPSVKAQVDKMVQDELVRENDLFTLSNENKIHREQICRDQLNEVLRRIAVNALPTFSNLTALRFEYLFFSQVLSRAYPQGMHLSRYQVRRLQKKAKELAEKKQSLVLLPCHKSHVDYISLVYVFFRLGLSIPMTMAGDNLNIPLISYFIKQAGATFIKRGNWKEDALYNAFFQGLVNTILQRGLNMQIFIEGTRSRSGKLLSPRYGLLKFIYEAVATGAVDDCWIVPVSTQYDKVVEADTYARELMGREKSAESLLSFLNSGSVINMNLGRIDVQFSEGFSLKSFIRQEMAAEASVPQIHQTLAYRVLGDINRVSVTMPSDLVGTILLTTRQRGLSINDLVQRIEGLIKRITERGGRLGAVVKPADLLTTQDIHHLVEGAISVLDPDLATVVSEQLLEPVCYTKDEFRLSYYRNRVAHLFVDEALVCLSLYQRFMHTSSLEIPVADLEKDVKFLSKLLSHEFVFDTKRHLPTVLKNTLARLQQDRIISFITEETITLATQELRSNWVSTSFYCYFVWPFIDGYWLAIIALQLLPRKIPYKIKDYLSIAQIVANTLFSEGAIAHIEAVNKEIILSALQQAELRQIITRTKQTITLEADEKTLAALSADLLYFRNEPQNKTADEYLLNRIKNLAQNYVASKL